MNHRVEYVVVCRGDSEPWDAVSDWTECVPGPYELATRTVFPTREAAQKYASGIAESRQAMIIPGRWGGLRWDAAERFPALQRRRVNTPQ